MSESLLRDQICEIGYQMAAGGLVVATEGNISARPEEDRILITPSGVSKGNLRPEDLIVTDLTGEPLEKHSGTPSSEFRLHVAIYAQRPDCQAIVHAHPPYATAFSMSEIDMLSLATVEASAVLGKVCWVAFAWPGTDEMPREIRPLAKHHKTFLLAHHGAVTLGKSVQDAFHRMQTLERTAQIAWLADFLPGRSDLSTEIQSELTKRFHHGDL
ncbi:MAG: class II aldolase/adducin family protein [Chthonomonas sp.]|nr:class II aldolase/adducin family protein [Chthonomonas sp.]